MLCEKITAMKRKIRAFIFFIFAFFATVAGVVLWQSYTYDPIWRLTPEGTFFYAFFHEKSSEAFSLLPKQTQKAMAESLGISQNALWNIFQYPAYKAYFIVTRGERPVAVLAGGEEIRSLFASGQKEKEGEQGFSSDFETERDGLYFLVASQNRDVFPFSPAPNIFTKPFFISTFFFYRPVYGFIDKSGMMLHQGSLQWLPREYLSTGKEDFFWSLRQKKFGYVLESFESYETQKPAASGNAFASSLPTIGHMRLMSGFSWSTWAKTWLEKKDAHPLVESLKEHLKRIFAFDERDMVAILSELETYSVEMFISEQGNMFMFSGAGDMLSEAEKEQAIFLVKRTMASFIPSQKEVILKDNSIINELVPDGKNVPFAYENIGGGELYAFENQAYPFSLFVFMNDASILLADNRALIERLLGFDPARQKRSDIPCSSDADQVSFPFDWFFEEKTPQSVTLSQTQPGLEHVRLCIMNP